MRKITCIYIEVVEFGQAEYKRHNVNTCIVINGVTVQRASYQGWQHMINSNPMLDLTNCVIRVSGRIS